jgi:hypothetical protein
MNGEPRDPGRTRFLTILAIRWIGTVLAIVGIVALNGRGLPREAGYVLAPIGLALAFMAPGLLARRWRTPRQ